MKIRQWTSQLGRWSLPLLAGLLPAVDVAGGEVPAADGGAVSLPVANPAVEEVDPGSVLNLSPRSPVRGGLSIEGYYDDNVFLFRPGSERGDFTWEIVPSVTFESSRPEDGRKHFFSFGYDPQVLRYADLSEIDDYNHRGSGGYRFTGARLALTADHRSAQFAGAHREFEGALFDASDTDVGRRTDGDHHLSRFDADLTLSGKSTLEIAARRFFRNYDRSPLASVEEWSGEVFYMLQVTGKTQVGIGPRFGRAHIDDAPDQVFSEALTRLVFRPSPKLAFDLSGGVDFRDFEGDGGGADAENAVFRTRAFWRLSEATAFSIEGFRDLVPAVNGQVIERTGVRASVRQRLGRKIFYTVRGGYEHRDYEPSRIREAADRSDDYFFVRNSLDYQPNEWSQIGIFHEFRENDSSSASDFRRNQAGFGISVQF